jgi:hypothetical protein
LSNPEVSKTNDWNFVRGEFAYMCEAPEAHLWKVRIGVIAIFEKELRQRLMERK